MIEKEVGSFDTEMEAFYGFAQAVKVGDTIYVSGQTAITPEGEIAGKGDMKEQMRNAYACIARLLDGFGATMRNIVDETIFVTDLDAAGPAAIEVRKQAYAGDFAVASSLIGVRELGAPELLIEIKCTARV